MPSALFTTGQSRWALHILVGVLSAIAIASSAPASIGGAEMYSGQLGDIRGLTVVLGACGLGSVAVLRTATILLPKPWRVYVDRLEFTVVAMLWICWTSATMAFSAFTLEKGVCSMNVPDVLLPTCPLLTFDLALLHLLSSATLSLLLVILSTTLSPSYYLSYSTSLDEAQGDGSKGNLTTSDVFVMWDMALASPPSTPSRSTTPLPASTSYGTQSPTTPLAQRAYAQPATLQVPDDQPAMAPAPPRKRDKFAEGRVWNYVPLLLVALGAVGCAGANMATGESTYPAVASSAFVIIIGIFTATFAGVFLKIHTRSAKSVNPDATFDHSDRALEVGMACIFFVLWPLAAIIFTLFPSIPNRACANPAAEALPSIDPPTAGEAELSCTLSTAVISLCWLAGWLFFARLLGLVFPVPDMDRVNVVKPTADGSTQGEGLSLLRSQPIRDRPPVPPVERPQMKWGRIVAGEAFELGDADDD